VVIVVVHPMLPAPQVPLQGSLVQLYGSAAQ
jgi:hypothetical protein